MYKNILYQHVTTSERNHKREYGLHSSPNFSVTCTKCFVFVTFSYRCILSYVSEKIILYS